jgi:uncharacterized protein (TIGR02284 family)
MLTRILQGAAAGAVAVWAMDRLDWYLFEHEDEKTRRLTDSVRPDGMDPGHALAHKIAGYFDTDLTPAAPHRQTGGLAAHYYMKMRPAGLYAAMRHRYPLIRSGRGALFGLTVFLLQDEGFTAVTGLAADPRKYPWQAHARGLAAHLVYGIVTDAALDVIEKGTRSLSKSGARKNKEVIGTLNRLIATCKDGEKGFRACADDMEDSYLKSAFLARADECEEAARELQQLVRSAGGKSEKSSSMSGALHRRWVDMKAMVTGKDTVAILRECERGEKVALSTYQSALKRNLPENVRAVVEKQTKGVQHNYDRVLHLRTSAQAGMSMINTINESRYH